MSEEFNNSNKIINKRKIALLIFKYSKAMTIIILLLIFTLSYLFIISPKYKRIQKTSDRLAMEKMDELQKLDIYLNRLKNFNKSFRNISPIDRERVEKIIPENNDYEDLIILVEDIVNDRNLVLDSIKFNSLETVVVNRRAKAAEDESDLPENIDKINFSVTISGVDYVMIKKIILDFERSLRLMDIQDVDFADGSSLDLEIDSYYFKS